VETRQLATFVAVARSGSFSDAAAELGYTQSAVSQQISALEERASQKLLERRPVRLTPAGERLLQHAEAILLRLDAAATELRHAAAPPGQHMRIGATPLAVPDTLASALAGLGSAALSTAGREDVLRDLAAARLDLALVAGYVRAGEPLLLSDPGVFATAPIRLEDAAVAFADGHPFAARAEVALADLADAWWLDAPRLGAPLPMLRGLTGAAEAFRARVTYDGEDVAVVLSLIASGRGLAVLPRGALHSQVIGRPLAGHDLVHRVEAAWLRRGAPRGVEELVARLRG
jgi:DNA-binding transcriptional LysR family regulator